MLRKANLPWYSPLHYAAGIPDDEETWALLYSGMETGFTGRYSFLAMKPSRSISSHNFLALEQVLTSHQEHYANFWLGYLGYGLKNVLEELPQDAPSIIHLPELWMVQYRLLLVFDHKEKTVAAYAASEEDYNALPQPVPPQTKEASTIALLASNMTKTAYLSHVETIREAIFRGDVYQANLTRKFYGQWEEAPSPFSLFLRLCECSPAPYSTFLKYGETAILSSSPEQFLQMDKTGHAKTRPIKGSAPRFTDTEKDTISRKNLEKSEKDRAENLMIVDLMRNDLSRHCTLGSVKVDDLFKVTSYATVHHMASTVSGIKNPESTPLDLVKGCFPAGSMTGAPKIEAMELCSSLEPQARGVYSGAIGWFGGDGSLELSVVIRTLVVQGTQFEFQVGGAIVADSTPEGEWQETITKARGIAEALTLPLSRLEAL